MMTAITHYNGLTQPPCITCVFHAACEKPSSHRPTFGSIAKKQLILKPGQLLSRLNENLRSIYAIQEGAIKAYAYTAEGKERITSFYLPSELIGFESLPTGKMPTYLSAISKTKLCEIPISNMLAFIEHESGYRLLLLKMIAGRLNLDQFSLYVRAEQQLAAFLNRLVKRLFPQCKENTVVFNLPMSRLDIANYLGFAPETITRLFQKLEKRGILIAKQKKICLLDRDKLESQAAAIK